MTNRRATLRNVLVVGGGYFLSAFLAVPVSFAAMPWLNQSHPIWMKTTVTSILFSIACALGGLAVGACIESRRPLGWALALGAVVAVLSWRGWRWYIPPDLGERLMQAAQSFIPAIGATAGALFGWRYANTRGQLPEVGA